MLVLSFIWMKGLVRYIPSMIGVNRWKIYTINYAFVIYTPNEKSAIVHVNNMIDFTNTIEHSILCTNQSRIN